jgi:hypothetical protein
VNDGLLGKSRLAPGFRPEKEKMKLLNVKMSELVNGE